MAQFVSAGTRRRRLVLSCVATGVAALIVGALVGRASVATVGERARSIATTGGDLATRLDALTIEYEQAVADGSGSGSPGESVAKGVVEPLREIDAELRSSIAAAPWVTPRRRTRVLRAVTAVRRAATSAVTPTAFAATTSAASAAVRDTLGVR